MVAEIIASECDGVRNVELALGCTVNGLLHGISMLLFGAHMPSIFDSIYEASFFVIWLGARSLHFSAVQFGRIQRERINSHSPKPRVNNNQLSPDLSW